VRGGLFSVPTNNDTSITTIINEEIHKMTKIIEFTRQLWPQPPKDAKPSWYLINTLGFFKNGEKVWEQEIPETDVKRMVTNEWGRVELDHPGYGFHVEYDKGWGWLLKFRMTHQQAEKVWNFISDRAEFYDVYNSSQPKVKTDE